MSFAMVVSVLFIVLVLVKAYSLCNRMPEKGEILIGLEYKSRGFSRKLRPGELLHGHNSVNSQQILMGLRGTLPISLDRVYPKYQND